MQIPTYQDILDTYQKIKPYIHQTPILTCESINQLASCKIYFKCENFQKCGSFKARGSISALTSLPKNQNTAVCTHSSGNHGSALSYMAKQLNIQSYIVMPNNSSQLKKHLVKQNGGNLIECGPSISERENKVKQIQEEKKAEIIHPYNDYRVIRGQGTCTIELYQQLPTEVNLDYIIVPVGGGGLLSGTIISSKYLSPKTKVVAAEPFLARDAFISLQTGKLHPQLPPITICDGIRASLGDKTFEIIKNGCDGIFLVEEKEVVDATNLIWQRLKIVVEPTSATVLAAIIKYKNVFQGKQVAAIISGGNFDIEYSPKL